MRVIAFASQKGGSGKTTISGHMAVAAVQAGFGPTVMVDVDPQGSLTEWWGARSLPEPSFAQVDLLRLSTELDVLRAEGFKLAIIDTPPAITGAIQTVVSVADLVVIPTRPSPHDLRAAGATVDLIERAGKPLVFVVNAATARARITAEAAIALSQHGTVAPTTVHNRTEFASSMTDGRTVMELNPGGRSAQEMEALWGYLQERLERNFKRTVFQSRQATNVTSQSGFGRKPGISGIADAPTFVAKTAAH